MSDEMHDDPDQPDCNREDDRPVQVHDAASERRLDDVHSTSTISAVSAIAATDP